MKTNIERDDTTRLEVGQILHRLLGDESVLYATTRDDHWNVTGSEFCSLHPQFEKQDAALAGWNDEVAGRARAIGVGELGNWGYLTKAASNSAEHGIGLPAAQMRSGFLALHEDRVVQLRDDNDALQRTPSRFRHSGLFPRADGKT